MSQLFLDNDECQFFYQVYKQAKYFNLARNVNQMESQAIGSEALGRVLYSASPFFADNGIDEDFFVRNYLQIIEAFRAAGTFDAYYYLIKSALGEDTSVSFDNPSAGYLVINVSAQTYPYGVVSANSIGGEQELLVPKGLLVQTEDGAPSQLIANSTVAAKTVEQLQYVLDLIVPAGIFVEFNLTQDPL